MFFARAFVEGDSHLCEVAAKWFELPIDLNNFENESA
jgi:hypothetical protein